MDSTEKYKECSGLKPELRSSQLVIRYWTFKDDPKFRHRSLALVEALQCKQFEKSLDNPLVD